MFLQNKVAIVTGGTRGIGRAIVLALAAEGCDVIFNYAKSKEQAVSLVQEVKNLKRKALAYCADIKDYKKVKEMIDEAKEKLGGLDILVNNAGILRDKALVMMDPADWQEVIDTNLTGVFNATRAAIYGFLKEKKGDIINITSVSGLIGLPRQTNYSAAKAGIIGFTKALAKEVGSYNIRVNAVAPGFIDTDMVSAMPEKLKVEMLKLIPQGRFGKPEDVAKTVLFLLSDEAKYITGQVITLDGGLAM